MLYSAQPVVNIIKDGYTTVIQVPTFYVDSQIQMIVDIEGAEHVVINICNPTRDKHVIVHPNVVPVTWALFDGPERISI